MPDNFFVMLQDGSVQRVPLLQKIETSIRTVFTKFGAELLEAKDELKFDGNYKIDDDEVMYVSMQLPNSFDEILKNPIGIPILNLKEDQIKALFWFENGTYCFQNFDNRKMLEHKNVLFFNSQTFDKLTQDAFVVDNAVNAVHKEGKFYFTSYANANKIFNLSEFFQEATNSELTQFGKHRNISVSNSQWFIDNSNTVIRKQITLIQKSKILEGIDVKRVKKFANKFKVIIELDKNDKIIFPCDKQACKDILCFLNEQFYEGVITKKQYKTNSNKLIS